MDDAITSVIQERLLLGRMSYTGCAVTVAGVLVLLSVFWASLDKSFGILGVASIFGTLGAFMSMAVALRRRAVSPDHRWRPNFFDAGLRTLVGLLSAVVILVLMRSALNPGIKIGSFDPGALKEPSIYTIAIIGFLAGFFERLLPDFLKPFDPDNTGQSGSSSRPATAEPH
ncbi:hypothetical protein [Jiella sp. M17.18]|uniref:hypothetical protein n=1 Tax=Jiella sp. M17.18 TaxID=3234247 RepID=UPI0034DF9BE2